MTRKIGLLGSTIEPCSADGPAAELKSFLPIDVELVAYPSRVGVFPYTALEETVQRIGHLEAALTAQEDGCDAVVIDSTGDYGLAAMRAGLTIPAIGAGAAGMAAAAKHGRFQIVTVWPQSMNFITRGVLRDYQYENACLGITNLGDERDLATSSDLDGYLSAVRNGRLDLIERIDRSIAQARTEGAAAILLGCTCMSAIAGQIAAHAEMPVINPLKESVLRALEEPIARRASTIRTGRREMIATMVDAIAAKFDETCKVCSVPIGPS